MAVPPLPSYTKPHATGLQRVQHLRGLGLVVLRPNVAAKKIDAIGYERLRIYLLSRRDHSLPNKPFLPGVTYKDILSIYECDAKLRDACFFAVGQFEIHFRNSVSERLSQNHGSHPYSDVGAFKDSKAQLKCLQTFSSIYLSSKDGRAKHYRDTYGHPFLPPIWRMKEFLTFGKMSFIFKDLSKNIRDDVAADFGVSATDVFTNWIDCLVDLRNICAHHDRLFNRSLQKQPGRLRSPAPGVPLVATPKQKLKAILECLDYMMNHRGSPVKAVDMARKIISKYPKVSLAEAGY